MTKPEEVRQDRLTELHNKLRAREDRPGTAANVTAIKAQIAALESDAPFRSVETKQFVPVEFAIQNIETTEPVEIPE